MDVARLQRQNLASLLSGYAYDSTAKRILSILDRNSRDDPGRPLSTALRHHSVRKVNSAIEIWFRKSIDSLLSLCGLLEISSQAQFIDLAAPPQAALGKQLLKLLEHPDVATYYTEHYPLLLPRLLCARLRGQVAPTEPPANATATVLDLLALDTRFRNNHEGGILLKLLDDYTIHNIRFEQVAEALGDPGRFVEMLIGETDDGSDGVLRDAVREFPYFLLFCIQFTELLHRNDHTPIFQSACWHYYGYWFGLLGKKLQRNLSNGVRAIETCLQSASVEDVGAEAGLARGEVGVSIRRSMQAVNELMSGEFYNPVHAWLSQLDTEARSSV